MKHTEQKAVTNYLVAIEATYRIQGRDISKSKATHHFRTLVASRCVNQSIRSGLGTEARALIAAHWDIDVDDVSITKISLEHLEGACKQRMLLTV